MGCFVAGLTLGAIVMGLIGQGLLGDLSPTAAAYLSSPDRPRSAPVNDLTVFDLLEMTDQELERVDPMLMNLIVLKGVPGHEELDVTPYLNEVDRLAKMIGTALEHGEAALRTGRDQDPLYDHDPDLWRAGGMAIALSGPRVGIEYTTAPLDPRDVAQTFVAGLIDTKKGTCASMPVLYLAISHRLDWPLKAVVSRDHMWCRWDDGEKQFNLEATTAESDGQMGSFLSTPDEEYIRTLGTSELAIRCGSDLASLSRRQLLGIFLESRAAFWAAQEGFERAEHDLMLARVCFPENRETFAFMHRMAALRAGTLFTDEECLAQSRQYQSLTREGRRRDQSRTESSSSPASKSDHASTEGNEL